MRNFELCFSIALNCPLDEWGEKVRQIYILYNTWGSISHFIFLKKKIPGKLCNIYYSFFKMWGYFYNYCSLFAVNDCKQTIPQHYLECGIFLHKKNWLCFVALCLSLRKLVKCAGLINTSFQRRGIKEILGI